jgi:hypothetical protein
VNLQVLGQSQVTSANQLLGGFALRYWPVRTFEMVDHFSSFDEFRARTLLDVASENVLLVLWKTKKKHFHFLIIKKRTVKGLIVVYSIKIRTLNNCFLIKMCFHFPMFFN